MRRVLLILSSCAVLQAAPTLITGTKGSGGTNASATIYGTFGVGTVTNANTPTTEADAGTKFRTAGVLSKFYCRFVTYDRAAATLKTRVGGADGAQSLSVSASGEFTDITHTDNVALNDVWDWQLVTGSGGTASALFVAGVVFTPTTTSATVTKFGGFTSKAYSTNSTTYFWGIGGAPNADSALNEARNQVKFKTPGSLRNLWVWASANTRSTDTSLVSRVAGANGNLAVTITSSTTGFFEDTTHSDAIAIDSLVALSLVTSTGTGTLTIPNYGNEFQTGNGTQVMTGLNLAANVGIQVSTTAATRWMAPQGDANNQIPANGVEADYSTLAQIPMTLTSLGVFVVSNDLNVTTLVSRVNAANGGQAVSISNAGTGYFGDIAGSDRVVATDELSLQWNPAATGTIMRINAVAQVARTAPIPHRTN